MADEALGIIDFGVRAVREDGAKCGALLDVSQGRCRCVGGHDVDILWLHAGALQGHTDAFGLAFGVGQDGVGGVGIDTPTCDFGDDSGSAGEGIVEALEHVDGAALRDDDTVTVLVEGAGGLGRILVGAERTLVLEAGEDTEGVDGFGHAAGEGDINLPEL